MYIFITNRHAAQDNTTETWLYFFKNSKQFDKKTNAINISEGNSAHTIDKKRAEKSRCRLVMFSWNTKMKISTNRHSRLRHASPASTDQHINAWWTDSWTDRRQWWSLCHHSLSQFYKSKNSTSINTEKATQIANSASDPISVLFKTLHFENQRLPPVNFMMEWRNITPNYQHFSHPLPLFWQNSRLNIPRWFLEYKLLLINYSKHAYIS